MAILLRRGIIPVVAAGFAPACSQCSSFLARATNVTLTADKQNYSNLICGLVTDGVWSKLDALVVPVAVDRTTAVLNLVSSSFPATENGTVSFAAYQGYTGDGSTFYLDSVFNPSTAGGNYVQNSASIGAYLGSYTSGNWMMGVVATTAVQIGTFGTGQYLINDLTGSDSGVAFGAGLWSCARTGASARAMYKNGSSIASDSTASNGLPTDTIYALARRTSGPEAMTARLQAYFIGAGLTGTDMANLSTRLNTYMTAYGVNAY